jgi:competence protein ComEC
VSPPSAILFTFALGAGLLTGLSRFLDPWFVAVPGLVLAVAVRHRGGWILPAAVAAGALLAETAIAREAGRCAAALPAGELVLQLRLADPVGAGTARARPLGAGCHGTVTLRLDEAGSHPAGTVLEVSGRWIPRPPSPGPAAGTLVARAHRVLSFQPTAPERLRTAISEAFERLYGPRAPVVDALILGRRATMDPVLREDFARAGLVHLLSISGFHVGLLISWTVLVALMLRTPRPRAYGIGAVVAVAYVAFLGWPAPATRAAALGVLIALGVVRQRAVRASSTLAAAALAVMVVEPWAVLDAGAWLSFSAVAGLAAATRWSDRALGTGWGWRMLAASVGSTAATAPITAFVLGAVAPVGVALNFLAIPLAIVAVPGVLASLMASLLLPPLAAPLAAGAGLALGALEALARIGASVPGGHLLTEPGWQAAVPWVAVLLAGLWGIQGRSTTFVALRRWGVVLAGGVWCLVVVEAWSRRADSDDAGLALHFLDVGQGDATLIRTPGRRWVLVDAGPADQRMDAGRRVVGPYLARQGVRRLEVAVVSHAHADHFGGLPAVLRRLPAALVLEPGMPASDAGYGGFLDWVASEGQRWRPARRGESFELDGVLFDVLHPDTTWSWWGLDLNENSLVVRLEWRGFVALLPGDAGFPAESAMAGRIGRADLLKVGHHGSRGSTSERLLAETRPAIAVVSAGRNNRHGHPAPAALDRLAAAGARVFRTDRDGTIRVTVTPGAARVRSATGDTTFVLRP